MPQDFTWVVTFANVPSAESAGLALRSLPTTGSAYGDVWQNLGSGWQLDTDSSDEEGNLDLGASAEGVAVVPEPTTIIAGAMLLLPFAKTALRLKRPKPQS